MSLIEATTKPHLKAGAQKNMVLGPAGCSQRGLSRVGTNFSPIPTRDLYTIDMLMTCLVTLLHLKTSDPSTTDLKTYHRQDPFQCQIREMLLTIQSEKGSSVHETFFT